MLPCRQYQEELTRRYGSDSPFSRSGGSLSGSHGNNDSLTAALKERLQLDVTDKSPPPPDLAKLPTQQLVKRLRKAHDELVTMVSAVTVNADRLLGQDVEYSAGGQAGEAGYS